MSLLTVAEARALVKTGLSDPDLQSVINREEALMTQTFGAHYVDANTTVVETLYGGGASLFLRRRLASVASIVEDTETLTATDYRLWGGQGRIERLPTGTKWLTVPIVVTYVPADDNLQRKAALIELVRLTLERTPMQSESIAGEYSFSAPDWERERVRLIRRLGFVNI